MTKSKRKTETIYTPSVTAGKGTEAQLRLITDERLHLNALCFLVCMFLFVLQFAWLGT